MIYTDGRQPSEFTDSNFSGEINNCLINIENTKAKKITKLKKPTELKFKFTHYG